MKIFRSIFWLGMAFMLIGPHVDLDGSVSPLSEDTIVMGEKVLGETLNGFACSNLECLGTKAAISVGISQAGNGARQLLQSDTHQPPAVLHNAQTAPAPQPRLVRKG